MRAPVLPIILTLSLFPLSASAEVIYMKNGTRVEGRILKQTKDTINLQLPFEYGDVLEIPKTSIDVEQPPSPTTALVLGLAFPGGGQLYQGNIPGALLYFGLTSLAASIGFEMGGAIAPSSATALGQGIGAGVGAMLPWITGSLEARRTAAQEAKEIRFKVEYNH